MSTCVNPTEEEIKRFCDLIREHLLAARSRGSQIEIGIEQMTEDVFTPEYGQCPTDVVHVGATFSARFIERKRK